MHLIDSRRGRSLVLVLAAVLGVMMAGGLALAASRPPTEFALFLRLNGEPTRLGVLVSTGTSITNATTGTPFTLNGGEPLKIICDAKAFITVGGTASNSYTNANLGHPVLADTPYYLTLGTASTTISSISSSGTTNCTVWRMD